MLVFSEVRIYNAKGKLKKVIPAKTVSRRNWKNVLGVQNKLFRPRTVITPQVNKYIQMCNSLYLFDTATNDAHRAIFTREKSRMTEFL